MAKNSYETEIELQKKLIKMRMDDCIEIAKKEFDLTYRNFKEFGIVPFDHQYDTGRKALENFQLFANRLSEIENLDRTIKNRKYWKKRDRIKSKSRTVRVTSAS